MRIAIADFKARCLGLLEELHSHGGRIVVTKRGREIALVEPAPADSAPQRVLSGARMRPDWR